ncbi:MAG TPA: hypothetical protein VN697_09350 [Tepidiformaceae bacterium]|nr:hypothetical protein [Tepidiformaceae bacterium]
MKEILVEAALLALAVLLVMAFVFRNQRAKSSLLFVRNATWMYIGAVFLLGAIELARKTL